MENSNLAIKYIPTKWSEIFGNKTTVKELQNRAISGIHNKTTLLLGETGKGKTSIARLYAKSILCLELDAEGNPCNTCDFCRTVNLEYPSNNVYFYDGANIGKDEATKISEQASRRIMGVNQTKIFFINELQSIKSKEAQNSLLTTLEREKDNACFIMTAMEWDKLKDALSGRNSKYFIKLNHEDIRNGLISIVEKEGITVTKELAEMVVTIVDNCKGSLREAIFLLERVIFSELKDKNEMIDELGIMSSTDLNDIVVGILKQDKSIYKTKWNEEILKSILFKFNLIYKKSFGIRLERWESALIPQIKELDPEKIKLILKELYSLNKYSYLTPQLIEFTMLNLLTI